MSAAEINVKLRERSTYKINTTLIEVCTKKKIEIQDIMRSTFQFLYVIDEYAKTNIETSLEEILNAYDEYEYNTLSDSTKLINTHITIAQLKAYNAINIKKRSLYLNKLISIAINNINYSSVKYTTKINKDPIINSFTVDYFLTDNHLNSYTKKETKILIMKNLLTKINHTINNKNIIDDGFYNNLYKFVFNETEAKDFYNQLDLPHFLLQEFEKIYFAMIKKFKIQLNQESKKSYTRVINKKYMPIYKDKYNKDITLFLKNEIALDNDISDLKQIKEFSTFIISMSPGEMEQEITILSLMQL